MIAFLAATDFSEWIGKLVSFAILFMVFVGGPLLRALKESAEKRRAAQARGIAPADAKSAEDEARRAWEALLRGETVEREPVAPPPVPTPLVQRERASQPEREILSAPSEGPPPLHTLGAPSSEDTLESQFDEAQPEVDVDEERRARETRERELAEERERRRRFRNLEQESGGDRADVAPAEISSLQGGLAQIANTDAPVRARVANPLFGAGGGNARARLRQAVLAREVLGPPRSLEPLEFDRRS